MKKLLLISTLALSLTAAHGQTNCAKEYLIGEWRLVKSITKTPANVPCKSITATPHNIETLKKLVPGSNDTIGILYINSDSTYAQGSFRIEKKNDRRIFAVNEKRRFTFNTNKCEIIRGTKRYARKHSNWQIIYLDDKFLFVRDSNNPHVCFIHLFVKVKTP